MKKAVIIYNHKSGNQKFIKKLNYVTSKLEEYYDKVTAFKTEHVGHATSLSRMACSKKTNLLVVVGGDGTFNECLNGIMRFKEKPIIGYIPSGTCCDIAKTLGISRNVSKALDNIINGVQVRLDVVKSNKLYFGYVTGTGAFIDVSYTAPSSTKKRLGYFAYIIQGAHEIFTIPNMKMIIKHDNGVEKGEYSLVLVLNFKRVAGFKVVKQPILDDGLVEVVLYKHMRTFNPFNIFLSFIFPNMKLKTVKKFKTSKLEISSSEISAWNIDGESGEIGDQIIEVHKQAVKMIVPEKAKQTFFENQEG